MGDCKLLLSPELTAMHWTVQQSAGYTEQRIPGTLYSCAIVACMPGAGARHSAIICMLLYMLMAVYMLPIKLGFMGTGAPKTPLSAGCSTNT